MGEIIVTPYDESQDSSEVVKPKPLLTTRPKILTNQTMWEIGKTSQIVEEMEKYTLTVVGISETHWTRTGQKTLATGEMILYSSHNEKNAPHTQGFALMMSEEACRLLVGW